MVDRSLSVLPKFISEGLLGNLIGSAPPTTQGKAPFPAGISRGFDLFVVSVRRCRNKYEEQQTVTRELQLLKTNISQPDITVAQMRDYVCRFIYCDTLNYDVSFGFINAMKLMHLGEFLDKKTGYLACSVMMHRDLELCVLLTGTIQKDLKSSNILENMMALSAASQLIAVDSIPYVLPSVIDKLKHSRELVRQKAVMCLYQFQLLAPDLLEHSHDVLQKTLFDKDPGVMAAAVYIVQFYIERDAEKCLHLGESLMSILKQITSHKMATMFEYHNVPFPWLQIQILKCLTKLVLVHESLVTKFIPLLKEILQRTSLKENIAFCVLYECLQCIVSIQSPKHLLDEAAEHIGKFLQSSSPNLKFIGVKLLVMLVKVNPEYSVIYQQLIVKSLENPDVNIQRKMHKLLYEIANESNIIVVCTKLLDQIKSSSDKYWKTEVIAMVISLVQRFEIDPQWRIDNLFAILLHGDDVIGKNLLNQVFSFLENRFFGSHVEVKSQKMLVTKCVSILVDGKSGTNAIHVALWTMGELCPLLKNMPDDKIISLVTQHLTNEKLPYHVHSCAVTTLQQFVYKSIVETVAMATKLKDCLQTKLPIVIRQRLSVILEVCEKGIGLSYHDNTSLDLTLTFLDGLVIENLRNGSMPFVPMHLRGDKLESVTSAAMVPDMASVSQDESLIGRQRTESSTSSTKTTEESDHGFNIPVSKKVWGKQGRLTTNKVEEATVTMGKNSEEDTKHKELATALFGGFLDKESDNDDKLTLLTSSSDNAGWRRLHTEKFQTVSESGLDTHKEVNDVTNYQMVQCNATSNEGIKKVERTSIKLNDRVDITATVGINPLNENTAQDLDNIVTTTSVESTQLTHDELDTALSSLIDTDNKSTHTSTLLPSTSNIGTGLSTNVNNLPFNVDFSAEQVEDSTFEVNELDTHYLSMSLEPPEVPDSMYSGCDSSDLIHQEDTGNTLYTELDGESLYSVPSDSLYRIDSDS